MAIKELHVIMCPNIKSFTGLANKASIEGCSKFNKFGKNTEINHLRLIRLNIERLNFRLKNLEFLDCPNLHLGDNFYCQELKHRTNNSIFEPDDLEIKERLIKQYKQLEIPAQEKLLNEIPW
jgi:hypothetical protein